MKKIKQILLGSILIISSYAIAGNENSNTVSEQPKSEVKKSIYTSANYATFLQNIPQSKTDTAKQKFAELFATDKLQFKNSLIPIYAANDFTLMWQSKKMTKKFLTNYFYFTLSGISKNADKKLHKVLEHYQSHGTLDLTTDIMISDLFLDYLYYTNNLQKQGNTWFYGHKSYSTQVPSAQLLYAWILAVHEGKLQDFIDTKVVIDSQRSLSYKQKLAEILQTLADADKNPKINSDVLLSDLHLLALNLQRTSIIPDKKDGIFVNVPTYHLDFYVEGKSSLFSKVVVGSTKHQTPFLISYINNIVVNPPWNPTTKIINDELLPKLQKNPNYAYSRGYNIIDRKGRVIDPYMIDWENLNPKERFRYQLRQVSSSSALGKFKFNIPNEQAIYLHDTPEKRGFQKNIRALSHGCVRVELSEKLVDLLLRLNKVSDIKIREFKNEAKTKFFKLNKVKVPVYLYYATTWTDQGKIIKINDIYKLDRLFSIKYDKIQLQEIFNKLK